MSRLERTEPLEQVVDFADAVARRDPRGSRGSRSGSEHWQPPAFNDWFIDAEVVMHCAARLIEEMGWTPALETQGRLSVEQAITAAAQRLADERKLADPKYARDRALTLLAICVGPEDARLTDLRHYPWPHVVRWESTHGLTEAEVLATLWDLADHYGPMFERMARDVGAIEKKTP